MLRGLCDYHVGENISEINLDLERYFDQLQSMGIKVLTFLTKDAMGTSYYPTKIGYRNRHVDYDLVGQAAEIAKQRGIGFVAYYNASLDDHLEAEHPDWRQVDANGKAGYVLNQYTAFCMNTPYRDRVRGQLEELAQDKNIQGVWLDITYIFEGRCYCEHCREKYKKTYGSAIPESPQPGSEQMLQLKKFRRDCRREFLEDFAKAVRDIRGTEFTIGWNHAGDIGFCQVQADKQASYFSNEFHWPNIKQAFLQTAWMRPFGKTMELMMSECLYGWGNWTVLPEATFKVMGAVSLATGAQLCLGHIPVPSGAYAGNLAEPITQRVGAMNKWLEPKQKICAGATALSCAAVISAQADQYRYAAQNNHWIEEATPSAIGAHRLLLEAHQPADLLCEDTLGKLNDYEYVVAPGPSYLPEPVCQALLDYVEQGGILIVDGGAGTLDYLGRPAEDSDISGLTGTHIGISSGLTTRYFDRIAPCISSGLPEMPILVRSAEPMNNWTLENDVEVLAYFTDPEYESKPRHHIYHQHGHPAVQTQEPAIVRRSFGKGQIVHILAPLSEDYFNHGAPAQRTLLQNIINLLAPQRRLHVSAPPSVRVTLMEKDNQLLIHLLHYHQNDTFGPSFLENELPVDDIHLSVRATKPLQVSQIGEETVRLPFNYGNGRVEIDVAPWSTHAIVAINF